MTKTCWKWSVIILLWFGLLKNVKPYKETQEAISIALESTGELIPRSKMVKKIVQDLKKIRLQDMELKDVFHDAKWIPGVLLTQKLSAMQKMEIENSEFKPVQIQDDGNMIMLEFEKQFHPEKLATLLHLRFGVWSQPKYVPRGNFIVYRDDLSTYYFNPSNGRNCENICLAQYSVSVNKFVSEEDNYNYLRK